MPTPNVSVVEYILQRYYAESPNTEQRDFVSSYWDHYSHLFQVQVDSDGNLTALVGNGFGVCKWNGLSHRILDRACMLSHLVHVPDRRALVSYWSDVVKVCRAMGLDPTFDVFRQVCNLVLLKKNILTRLHESRPQRLRLIVVGDGYGVFAALFKALFPDSSIALVDIGRTLLFQAYHLANAYPQMTHERIDLVTDVDAVDFMYCPTERMTLLEKFSFDLAVNSASMQEMNVATVARYFALLRRCLKPQNLFYCSNRESKTMLGGEESVFLKYPWQDDDQFLLDEYCPWQRYFFSPSKTERGLSILGFRVPLINFYDGETRHRLAVLDTESRNPESYPRPGP